VLLQSY